MILIVLVRSDTVRMHVPSWHTYVVEWNIYSKTCNDCSGREAGVPNIEKTSVVEKIPERHELRPGPCRPADGYGDRIADQQDQCANTHCPCEACRGNQFREHDRQADPTDAAPGCNDPHGQGTFALEVLACNGESRLCTQSLSAWQTTTLKVLIICWMQWFESLSTRNAMLSLKWQRIDAVEHGGTIFDTTDFRLERVGTTHLHSIRHSHTKEERLCQILLPYGVRLRERRGEHRASAAESREHVEPLVLDVSEFCRIHLSNVMDSGIPWSHKRRTGHLRLILTDTSK